MHDLVAIVVFEVPRQVFAQTDLTERSFVKNLLVGVLVLLAVLKLQQGCDSLAGQKRHKRVFGLGQLDECSHEHPNFQVRHLCQFSEEVSVRAKLLHDH